jgi:hypothetical protein
VQQEVAHAAQFQPRQLRGALRPHAAQGRQRGLQWMGRIHHAEFIEDFEVEMEGKGAFLGKFDWTITSAGPMKNTVIFQSPMEGDNN